MMVTHGDGAPLAVVPWEQAVSWSRTKSKGLQLPQLQLGLVTLVPVRVGPVRAGDTGSSEDRPCPGW